jgi:hypothetical protein
MTVSLTNSGGGIFDRFGAIAGGLADDLALQGAAATARVLSGASWATRGTTLETYAALSPAVSRQLDNHWTAIANWRNGEYGLFSSLAAIAQAIFTEQVHLDSPLSSYDLTSALTELIRQMTANATTINSSTVSLGSQTDGTPTPTGNPVIIGSLKNRYGLTFQTPFAETLRFQITGDSYATTATARQEPLSIKGKTAAPSFYDYTWPSGSGASGTLALVDAQLDNSGGNCLYGSDFETFTTANTPDDFNIAVGVAGTDIFAASTAGAYTGSNGLKFVGDGVTLPAVTQEFNKAHSTTANGGGTPYQLKPLTPYALNCWLKGGDSLAAGVFELALVDGSGTVIADANSVNNLTTLTLSGNVTAAGWTNFNTVFRTPATIAANAKLRVRTSTALASGKILYLDDLAMAEMTQLYKGGPYFAAFAGSTKVVTGDKWTLAVSSTMGTMAAWLERLFGLNARELIVPNTSSSPTIGDALVA